MLNSTTTINASNDSNDSKYAMKLRSVLVSPCIQGPSMFFSNADDTVKLSLCATMFTGMLDEKYLAGGERTTDYLTLQAEITAPLGTSSDELANYTGSVLDFCTDSALTTKVKLHIKDMSHIETAETQVEWKAAGELHRLVHVHCKVTAEYYEICTSGEDAVARLVKKSESNLADRLAVPGIADKFTRH